LRLNALGQRLPWEQREAGTEILPTPASTTA